MPFGFFALIEWPPEGVDDRDDIGGVEGTPSGLLAHTSHRAVRALTGEEPPRRHIEFASTSSHTLIEIVPDMVIDDGSPPDSHGRKLLAADAR